MHSKSRLLISRFLRCATLLLAVSASAAHAQTPAQPYTVEVWARVLFNTQGRAAEYAVTPSAEGGSVEIVGLSMGPCPPIGTTPATLQTS